MAQSASSSSQKVPPKKKKEKNRVWFWANECKYEVILDNVKNRKWKLIQDERYEAKSNMYWIDVATIHERFRTIQPWQTINHFPGMPNIARKNRMGQNLNRMQKLFPREYSFYPRTWVLPGEINDFRAQFDNQGNALGNKIFIIKPDTGCQGKGIFLTRTFDNIPQHENVVAQVYIKKPLLLDGYKFDLRIYCLVSSVKPLRMYLFQDGLVRMCTEEYTKPTKQNLSMVCMHLTNYAVNKFNSNFQQPSAKSSEEAAQDEVGKRSLHWFMNYIKEEHGESKATWLWKRIGTLCVRTVLSIMPTLSREYDQHFKSFVGIPYKSVIPKTPGAGAGGSTGNEKRARGESLGEENDAVDEDDEDEGDDDDDDDDDNNNDQDDDEANKSEDEEPEEKEKEGASGVNGTEGGGKKKKRKIQFRGSRCFEILGFDIMLDANLKPWLIEVNHLPSFGTDSPLDQDIKDRLMAQVLATVPVLPDDEQAYNAYHKQEATKRLLAKREADKQAAAAAAAAAAKAKPKRPAPSTNGSGNSTSNSAGSSGTNAGGGVGEAGKSQTTNTNQNGETDSSAADKQADDADEELDGEVTPERLQEIKDQLVVIYEVHSPEKVMKIDRLLTKYMGREEEFLRFVHLKYGLPPPLTKKQREREEREREKLRQQEEAEAAAAEAAAAAAAEEAALQAAAQAAAAEAALSAAPPTINEDGAAMPSAGPVDMEKDGKPGRELLRKQRQVSRSLSPTPSNPRKPAWKGNVEDDAAYKTEVLATHIPAENDEWMLREIRRLTQFTRIFPPESSSASSKGGSGDKEEDEEGSDDDGDKDDEDKAAGATSTATAADGAAAPAPAKVKSATYEEIMFQVFIQDKRQTMRLRCPLPSRARSGPSSDTASLPPLDSRSSQSSAMSSKSSSSKGLGWRAPPPKQEKKEVSKVVTQSQLESAKRLSQGLSVAQIQSQSTRNKYVSSNPPAVLIMDEYDPSIPPGQQQLTSAGNIWLQARLQNVRQAQIANLRGGRGINGRMVAAATPASVLRQQVFHFGSEAAPTGMDYSSMVSVQPASSSQNQYNQSVHGGHDFSGGFGGGITAQGSIAGRSIASNSIGVAPSGTNNYVGNTTYGSGGVGVSNGNRIAVPSPAGQGAVPTSGTQYIPRHADNEEMLRQLFPGWF